MNASRNPTTLYQLVAYEADDDTQSYPLALARRTLGIFTSSGEAEAFIVNELHPGHTFVDPEDVLRLHLFAFRANEERHFREVWVYEPDGSLAGHENFYLDDPPPPFSGRAAADCRYQPGDLVQFIPGSDLNHLHLGIVLDRPFTPEALAAQQAHNPALQLDATDDVYIVLFFTYAGLNHAHLPEYRLAPPHLTVDPELARRLQAAFIEKSAIISRR